MFDVESRELEKDIHYYQTCLESLLALSENAKVFCLVHKMDLIQEDQRSLMFDERAEQLKKLSLPLQVRNSNIAIMWILRDKIPRTVGFVNCFLSVGPAMLSSALLPKQATETQKKVRKQYVRIRDILSLSTASSSHFRRMLPESSGRPLPAKRPDLAT